MGNAIGTAVDTLVGASCATISPMPSVCQVQEYLEVEVEVKGVMGYCIEPPNIRHECSLSLSLRSNRNHRNIPCDHHHNKKHIFRFEVDEPGSYYVKAHKFYELNIGSNSRYFKVIRDQTGHHVYDTDSKQSIHQPLSTTYQTRNLRKKQNCDTPGLLQVAPKPVVHTLTWSSEVMSVSSAKTLQHPNHIAYVGKKYMLQITEIRSATSRIWYTGSGSPASIWGNVNFIFKDKNDTSEIAGKLETLSNKWYITVVFPKKGWYSLNIRAGYSHNLESIRVYYPPVSGDLSSISLIGKQPNEYEALVPVSLQIECKTIFNEKLEKNSFGEFEPDVILQGDDGKECVPQEDFTVEWMAPNIWFSQFRCQLVIHEPGKYKTKIKIQQNMLQHVCTLSFRDIKVVKGAKYEAKQKILSKPETLNVADMKPGQSVENDDHDDNDHDDVDPGETPQNIVLPTLASYRNGTDAKTFPQFDSTWINRRYCFLDNTIIIMKIGEWSVSNMDICGPDCENLHNINRVTGIDIRKEYIRQESDDILTIEFEAEHDLAIQVQDLMAFIIKGKYYRCIANAYENERVYFRDASQREYQIKNHIMAKQYSSMKEQYASLMENAHEQAKTAYFKFHNMDRQLSEIDLHDLRAYVDRNAKKPGEALQELKKRMKDEDLQEAHRWLEIIVGAGHHSVNNTQQIRKTVERFLRSEESHEFQIYKDADLKYDVINKGNILITFNRYTGKLPCQGQFYCKSCNRMWKSMRCWVDYGQLCFRCQTVQVAHKLRPASKSELPTQGYGMPGGPRHEDLCQKCLKLGHSCKLSNPGN